MLYRMDEETPKICQGLGFKVLRLAGMVLGAFSATGATELLLW